VTDGNGRATWHRYNDWGDPESQIEEATLGWSCQGLVDT
jgi:hypothetical protein